MNELSAGLVAIFGVDLVAADKAIDFSLALVTREGPLILARRERQPGCGN
jgi:hypothetical protein